MMQYCVVLAILFMTMVVVGIGVYFAFIKDKKEGSSPLLCSLDGRRDFEWPLYLCSHLVYLSAAVRQTPNRNYEAYAKDGSDQKFQEFKAITRDDPAVKKLVSFDVISIKTLSATEIDKLFTGLHGGELHGIDIRYIPSINLGNLQKALKELATRANTKKYIVHGVFDSAYVAALGLVNIASLRVYTAPTSPYKALPIQPMAHVEKAVAEFKAKLTLAVARPPGWNCIGFSLSATFYPKAKQIQDSADGSEHAKYCEFNRTSGARAPSDISYTVPYKDGLISFEQPAEFKEKVLKIKELKSYNSCVLLDDVFYDHHNCSCDDHNYKLLGASRSALWQTTLTNTN
ncbi:uncharacterized protein LOC144153141 [Haemaphysalis longicornis]